MNYGVPNRKKVISEMTISELKNLIKKCLRELEDEKQRNTYAGREAAYKQMWEKPPMTTDGLKCND